MTTLQCVGLYTACLDDQYYVRHGKAWILLFDFLGHQYITAVGLLALIRLPRSHCAFHEEENGDFDT